MYEHGLPWPQFSDDPNEQWLVCEALAAAYHAERDQDDQEQQARSDAAEQGRQRIADYRAARGR